MSRLILSIASFCGLCRPDPSLLWSAYSIVIMLSMTTAQVTFQLLNLLGPKDVTSFMAHASVMCCSVLSCLSCLWWRRSGITAILKDKAVGSAVEGGLLLLLPFTLHTLTSASFTLIMVIKQYQDFDNSPTPTWLQPLALHRGLRWYVGLVLIVAGSLEDCVGTLQGCLFAALLRTQRTAFHQVNVELRRARDRAGRAQLELGLGLSASQVRELRRQYRTSRDVVGQMQSAFGVQTVASYFSCAWGGVYFGQEAVLVYLAQYSTDFEIGMVFWLVPRIMTILQSILAGDSVAAEAGKTMDLLHELINLYGRDGVATGELQLFACQLAQRPVKVQLVGFVDLETSFILTSGSLMASYLIICWQNRSSRTNKNQMNY